MEWFGIVSYSAAALVYGAAAAVLIAGHPGGRPGYVLIAAMIVTVGWAVGLARASIALPVTVALEVAFTLAWTVCTLSWLGSKRRSIVATLSLVSVGLAAWAVAAAMGAEGGLGQGIYLAMLGMGLVGLLAVEQLFRNAVRAHRERIGLLCFGLGGVFVLNIVIYSQANLLGSVLPVFWEGRGLASAGLAVVIVVGVKRLEGWERELFVSRYVVFYTASLIAVGGYLLAMGAAGYLIYLVGGEWGALLQWLFLVVAVALLVVIIFSEKIRAKARALLVKHFYKNKYDYREEWLRLTEILGRGRETRTLAQNALNGIARIAGSPAGTLWLSADAKRYECFAALGEMEKSVAAYPVDHPIVQFLMTTGWVIDSLQYQHDPDQYGSVFGEPEARLLPDNALIVPLDRSGFLQGFAVLLRPPFVTELNFEDHDILKTAGRQVAFVLAQAVAQEQLAATRQFEAMNKLSTFLMHDLKNVIAQQELVVHNARKFKHRPEFINDAVLTLEAGVQRMRSILRRLENSERAEQQFIQTDLVKLLEDVCRDCSNRQPRPRFCSSVLSLQAEVDRDRVAMAVTHAVRNAQDATPEEGQIEVRLERGGSEATIAIVDTGSGMSTEFVRDRLFRPFDTTKGAKGMGIGAYQIRETLRSAGGEVYVRSQPGRGTTLELVLPVSSGSERSVA